MMNIAVVGSGIAGMSAAYLLSRAHRVTLFERDARVGGHTHTIVITDRGRQLPLDTGFLVHNHRTYPHLVRLFDELGVRTRKSDMSFSVSCAETGLEYSSRGMGGFFAQRRRLASSSHYRLLWQIARFNREAPRLLESSVAETVTVADYLALNAYDGLFTDYYLLPMTAAIWSAAAADVARFPLSTIVRFLHNHGMLAMGSHPTWYVVDGGSHAYIPKLLEPLGERVHCDARLVSIRRHATSVALTFDNRPAEVFDHVVLACHGDQVLPLLLDPSEAERAIFSRFTTTANDVWLHTDRSFLPANPRAQASWNYRISAPAAPPQVTYHLNRLQSIDGDTDYCVTLNPAAPPASPSVIRRMTYRHPQLHAGALRSQHQWSDVSGVRRTHYCGAYWRYGFHEDGLWSAIRVARALGVEW